MKALSLSVALLCCTFIHAQLIVEEGLDPQTVVQDHFLTNGVFTSNIQFNGQTEAGNNQVGTFNSENSNVGISQGITLATGAVTLAIGPNDSGGTSVDTNFPVTGDVDLAALDPSVQNDEAILEFDFIATGDSMVFTYVFGSEEYPEFVGSFNDAFGFFLSGPGIDGTFSNGGVNIALVPGTTDFVAINNINAGASDSECTNCEYYIINTSNDDPNGIQFDGFTVPLSATIGGLVIGEAYHIKLAIGDALDTVFDSGVFLKDQSFEFICTEADDNLAGGGGLPCSLCTVAFDMQSESCGSVTLVNTSEILIPYDDAQFTLLGETYDADGGPVTVEGIEAGEYEIELTIFSGEYTAVVTESILLGYETEFEYASLSTEATSADCMGQATIEMQGGNETFLFSWDDAPYTTSNTANDLCIGWHTVEAWSEENCLLGTFEFEIESSVGIEEVEDQETFTLYPNPSNGAISITTEDGGMLEIVDVKGSLVYAKRMVQGSQQVDLSILSEGVYFVQFGGQTQRLVLTE